MINQKRSGLNPVLTTVLERHGAGKEINLPLLPKLERECDDAVATTADREEPKDAVKPPPKQVKACIMTFHAITMRMETDRG